eukprot:1148314-Pelagomonas_calceolata.AAC.5
MGLFSSVSTDSYILKPSFSVPEGHFGEEGTAGRVPNYPSTTLPPPSCRKHSTTPRGKIPEWEYVTLVHPEGTFGVKQVKNKCKQCEHVFHGGATRIRLHFLQVPGCEVAECTAAEDKLEPGKKVMQQLEQGCRIRSSKKHRISLTGQRSQQQQHHHHHHHHHQQRRGRHLQTASLKASPTTFTNQFYHALKTATFNAEACLHEIVQNVRGCQLAYVAGHALSHNHNFHPKMMEIGGCQIASLASDHPKRAQSFNVARDEETREKLEHCQASYMRREEQLNAEIADLKVHMRGEPFV